MPRIDLLALSADDLAAITNRGTVKRAERDLQAGTPTCQIEELPDGQLSVVWSDGIVCRFPAGETVHNAVCSSGMAGISRHVIRSVLAYQKYCGESAVVSPPTAISSELPPQVGEQPPLAAKSTCNSWNPGDFTDDELITRFRQAAVTKARRRFEQGVLVELTRGQKPLARFFDEPCTLRFLVPGDLRYITADCAEPLLSTFVPLAVWAFRLLPADQAAGLVSNQQDDLPTPKESLAELRTLLLELCASGLAGCGASWPQRMARLEMNLREAGLVWPAELISDLLRQHEMYVAHDACFDPLELVHLAGELLARSRAIGNGTKSVPQLLIRGTRSDRVTEIAGGRLIGLGLGVRLGRRVTTFDAYLQDTDSGSVVAVRRTTADPAPESGNEPRSFADLADTVVTRSVTLGGLGASQLLLKSGKRTPSGHLILPRASAAISVNPQAFAWEQLKPPTAVESFAQLAARMAVLPPSYLRPRRPTESLHVCTIERVEDVMFDAAQQRLTAVLYDNQGGSARLVHPFNARGRSGFEAIVDALEQRPEQVRFVCGHISQGGRGLVIRPICLVLDDGRRRVALQPWIDRAAHEPVSTSIESVGSSAVGAPLQSYLEQISFELSELLLSGLCRCDARSIRTWTELAVRGQRLGFVKLVDPINQLAELLTAKADTLRWDAMPAAGIVLALCLNVRVASDIL